MTARDDHWAEWLAAADRLADSRPAFLAQCEAMLAALDARASDAHACMHDHISERADSAARRLRRLIATERGYLPATQPETPRD